MAPNHTIIKIELEGNVLENVLQLDFHPIPFIHLSIYTCIQKTITSELNGELEKNSTFILILEISETSNTKN